MDLIRPIHPSDLPAVALLTADLGYPAPLQEIQQRVQGIANLPDHAIFVACESCAGHALFVVGWIHVFVVHHLQSEPRAEIGGLIVAVESRNTGVGAKLVARAEHWARERNLSVILVRSNLIRADAHRFYLREGYAQTKTSAVFTKNI